LDRHSFVRVMVKAAAALQGFRGSPIMVRVA
jgi:hypothetical protein